MSLLQKVHDTDLCHDSDTILKNVDTKNEAMSWLLWIEKYYGFLMEPIAQKVLVCILGPRILVLFQLICLKQVNTIVTSGLKLDKRKLFSKYNFSSIWFLSNSFLSDKLLLVCFLFQYFFSCNSSSWSDYFTQWLTHSVTNDQLSEVGYSQNRVLSEKIMANWYFV